MIIVYTFSPSSFSFRLYPTWEHEQNMWVSHDSRASNWFRSLRTFLVDSKLRISFFQNLETCIVGMWKKTSINITIYYYAKKFQSSARGTRTYLELSIFRFKKSLPVLCNKIALARGLVYVSWRPIHIILRLSVSRSIFSLCKEDRDKKLKCQETLENVLASSKRDTDFTRQILSTLGLSVSAS